MDIEQSIRQLCLSHALDLARHEPNERNPENVIKNAQKFYDWLKQSSPAPLKAAA
jgi:hypothetical protein